MKEEGNAHYKNKEYRKALLLYSRAIELCPDCAVYYGNRAACRMMMGLYTDALQDARESIRLDPTFVKGYVRVVKCLLALGDSAAYDIYTSALNIDPNNKSTNAKIYFHRAVVLIQVRKNAFLWSFGSLL